MSKTIILITGGGAPGGPGIIKSLKMNRENYVITCDVNPCATGAKFSDDFFCSLPAADNGFKEFMLAKIKDLGIDIVVPLVTSELEKWSEIMLEQKIPILAPAQELISKLNNKFYFLEFCKEIGLPTVSYLKTDNGNFLINYVKEYHKYQRYCVVKPCESNGSRGVGIIDSRSRSIDSFIFDKPNSLMLDFYVFEEMFSGVEIPNYLVMDYLPGHEITCDILVQSRQLIHCFMRKRTKITSGISTAGEFINDKNILEFCSTFANNIDYNGVLGIQFKEKDGQYYPIECNPRLQGTSVAANGLGYNLPQLAVDCLLERASPFLVSDKNLKFARYYEELFWT